MEKYIVYAGGAQGYRLYNAHPDFPDAYRESIVHLYEHQHIVGPTAADHRRCYRFAPVQDRYVLSVIYKDCTCIGESRSIFASVNWLFTPQEADAFYQDDMQVNFFECVQRSDALLQQAGYTIPDLSVTKLQPSAPLPQDTQTALMTAAYYATVAAHKQEMLRGQVFAGCDRDEGLFAKLFWLLRQLPTARRKDLSYHLGASAASESFGTALVLMYGDVLEAITAAGNYSGAMATQKITLVQDAITSFVPLPAGAKVFARLSEEDRRLAKLLFDNANGVEYWQYLDHIAAQGAAPRGAGLMSLLSEDILCRLLTADRFTPDELVEMYDARQTLPPTSRAVDLLTQKAAPLVAQRDKKQANDRADGDMWVITGQDRTAPTPKKKGKKNKDKDKDKIDKSENKCKDHDDRDERRRNKDHRDREEAYHREETYAREGRHSQRRDKHAREADGPKRFAKGVARLLSWVVPVCIPLLLLLLLIGVGTAMYWVGVTYLTALPPQWARWLYAAQIGGLLLLGMPAGYVLFVSIAHLFSGKK